MKLERLTGGHVEFTIRNTRYCHYFHFQEFDYSDLEVHIQSGNIEEGLRKFIRQNYVIYDYLDGDITDKDILILSYDTYFS